MTDDLVHFSKSLKHKGQNANAGNVINLSNGANPPPAHPTMLKNDCMIYLEKKQAQMTNVV